MSSVSPDTSITAVYYGERRKSALSKKRPARIKLKPSGRRRTEELLARTRDETFSGKTGSLYVTDSVCDHVAVQYRVT